MGRVGTASGAVLLTLLTAPGAAADDIPQQQHNITYRARVDGIARGALITYRISDTQVNSANPTMLPGRIFETTAVLTDPKEAGMRISIQWPYSANLHCEILVDDELVVQASQFISPRLTPAKDDPDFGAINCGAPLSNAFGAPAGESPAPAPGPAAPDELVPPAPAPPPADAPPADAPPAVPPADAPAPAMVPGGAPPLDSLPLDGGTPTLPPGTPPLPPGMPPVDAGVPIT